LLSKDNVDFVLKLNIRFKNSKQQAFSAFFAGGGFQPGFAHCMEIVGSQYAYMANLLSALPFSAGLVIFLKHFSSYVFLSVFSDPISKCFSNC